MSKAEIGGVVPPVTILRRLTKQQRARLLLLIGRMLAKGYKPAKGKRFYRGMLEYEPMGEPHTVKGGQRRVRHINFEPED
jgi:hypothetical protein